MEPKTNISPDAQEVSDHIGPALTPARSGVFVAMTQEKSDVVIKSREQVCIFANASSSISIVSQDYAGNEAIITIEPRDVPLICRALRSVAKEMRQ